MTNSVMIFLFFFLLVGVATLADFLSWTRFGTKRRKKRPPLRVDVTGSPVQNPQDSPFVRKGSVADRKQG